MFCVGPHCQSAVLVRLTATKGAVVLRVARCDDYIEAMLKGFLRFYQHFVLKEEPPPPNFDFAQAALLAQDTVRLAKEATTVLARVPHRDVQRQKGHKANLLL